MSNNFLCAKCIIIVSFVCLFTSISTAGYWVELTHDDFEAGLGNWTADGGTCTWVRNQDNTPSNNTGPCGCNSSSSGYDHTIGDATGWYAYVEASNSDCQGSDLEAVLESPDLDADTYSSFAFSFYYHMFGSNMGDLYVDVYNGSSWDLDVYHLFGQQQSNGTDGYLQSAVADINSYTGTIKIRLRYNGVSGFGADVAIDDIEISGWVASDDYDVPMPNPATFSTAPNAASSTSISMVATTGTDASGPIEYNFATTGGPGANSSGWTTSNTYTDNGLTPGTAYTYTVQMRDNSTMGINTGTASGGFSATTLGVVPDVTLLAQVTAEANITSAGFAVGSIGQAFSNSVPLGNVISQTPTAGTELTLGSSVNLNVSKGTAVTDFEDLVAFASNWLTTDCGLCSDQDYSGDSDVDFEDYAFFAQEWLETAPATLVINEFMASNDTILADGFGEYDDWIEIYNYGTETVVMEGMHLADSGNTYIIPSGVSITAGQYLIFWADNQDTQGPLHTNFGLSAGGDEITLYDTDGVSLIDSITYRADQVTDISHGRFPDNTPAWYNMDDPTPGATNTAGMAGDVWFSKLSGTFTSSFNLELSTESLTAEIRYTTDDSLPTAGSTLYTGPISIGTSGTTRVRARAFETELADGPVMSHAYIPIDSSTDSFSSNLPIIVLDTLGFDIDTENNPGFDYTPRPVIAAFIDTDKDSGRASITDLADYAGRGGVEVRGSSSAGDWEMTNWPKKQYNFEVWSEIDFEDKDVPLLGMPADSDWAIHAPYSDKTLVRNALVYQLSNDMGHYATRTRFVEVFLNKDGGKVTDSDYWGVYVFMEKIKRSKDRVDIAGLDANDSTEPDITGGYIIKHDKDDTYTEETFTTNADMTGPFLYHEPKDDEITTAQKNWIKGYLSDFETALQGASYDDPDIGYAKYIDVESFIDHHHMVEITKEVDAFKFSTYMYKDRGGKLIMAPEWDYNWSLGNNDYTFWSPALQYYLTDAWYIDQADSIYPAYSWYDRLDDDAEYVLRAADRWHELREGALSDSSVSATIDGYLTLLNAEAAGRNYAKWDILNTNVWPNYYYGSGGDPHTFQMEVDWLKEWLIGDASPPASSTQDRLGWMDNNIGTAPPALLVNSVPMDIGGTITAGQTLTMTKTTSGTIYYTLDGTDPRAVGGGIAGLTYSSGITLNETKQVKARILNSGNWSAINEAIFSDDRLAGSLRITEVMYHPVDPNDEFIEFKNIGPSTINLAHCQLTKGVDFTFPDMTLAPDAYTIVVRNTAEFNARYPGYSGTIAGEYTLDKLDNGGENIRLKDAAGNIIQQLDYEDGWFPITDGVGYSLNLMVLDTADPNDWDKRINWEASNVIGGTPGASHTANTVGNLDILINEILTHTDDSQGDWVELHNRTGSSIDVGNWYLSDNKNNLKKYKITSPTNISAGGYLVLTATTHFQNALDPGSAVTFGLSEHGEEVFLTSGNGTDFAGGYSDGESFGSSRKDVTFGRYTKGAPTFNTDFIELVAMTQGTANDPPYVPDVVISEIMYNAQDIQDQLGEYIELHNRSGSTVYLYDLANTDNTWKFTKGIDFTFPTGVSIGAGQKILISRTHPDAFKVANGDPGVPVYGPFASGTELENDGEKIELSMPTDPDPGTEFISYIRVEQVNYSDGIHPLVGDPWPISADGRGDSLKRKVNGDYANDVANWEAAAPTPGS